MTLLLLLSLYKAALEEDAKGILLLSPIEYAAFAAHIGARRRWRWRAASWRLRGRSRRSCASPAARARASLMEVDDDGDFVVVHSWRSKRTWGLETRVTV